MFYEDLSPYAYTDDGDVFYDPTDVMRFVAFRPDYARLNIGWLDGDRRWPRGPVPEAFGDRLQAVLGAQQVNVMMGLHDCDLCPTAIPDSHPWYEPLPGHRCASAGTGEIHVPGPSGTVFAAPRLIGHYVADHGYLPPRAFVDAVLAFDPYGSWPARFPAIRFPWIPADAELRHVDDL
ncbi:hypothetical protein AB0N09_18425 [Streptomyces erythrochromogenes]|uniref:DUF7919 family protein n=1 Tax=Streptomyces erythrochromogenes TaxID=285574 RepID=UPI00341BEA3D